MAPGFHKDLTRKIYVTMLAITVVLASFGTYYIIFSLRFPRPHIVHLAGSVGFFTAIALLFDYHYLLTTTTLIRRFLSTGEAGAAAYREALRFPLRYALICLVSYYTVVAGVMVYMRLAVQSTAWELVMIVIGGFVVANPAALLVYLTNQAHLLPLTRRLFQASQINSLADVGIDQRTPIGRKITVTFLVVSANAFVAIDGYFLYTYAHITFSSGLLMEFLYNILLISGFNLVLAILAAVMLSRFITIPLAGVADNLRDIAQARGDLRQKADILTTDELSTIGGWFNIFLANMQQMVRQVRDTSDQVSRIAASFSRSTDHINAGAEQGAATITQVAQGANKQVTHIQSVVSLSGQIEAEANAVLTATHQAEELIQQMEASALDGRQKAVQSVDDVNAVVTETHQAVAAMKELSDHVQQVGSIVETISTIAAQTNLLALNAAIEAARAGQHRGGFAVIAEEIRNLNADITVAAQEIATIIRAVHQSSGVTIVRIETVAQQANTSQHTIDLASTLLHQIAASATEMNQAVAHISDLAQAQQQGLTKVVELVEETSAIAENNAAVTQEVSVSSAEQSRAVEEIAAAAQDLHTVATQLKAMMQQFKT